MLSDAVIIGRNHRLMQQNCHDFACSGSPLPGYAFGLVLDGCGSKYIDNEERSLVIPSHNEIGAKLMGEFIFDYLKNHLPALDQQPYCQKLAVRSLLTKLFNRCLGFLSNLIDLFPFSSELNRRRFIATHLLSTIVGFVVTPETAAFFWLGDGYICQDQELKLLDSHNQPNYLAYKIFSQNRPPLKACAGFNFEFVPNQDETNFLAVATDGCDPGLLAELGSPRTRTLLQRWINVQARQRNHFEDDGAVAA